MVAKVPEPAGAAGPAVEREELRVDEGASRRLMDVYGPFAATERLLMEAVKRGGDRQALHATRDVLEA